MFAEESSLRPLTERAAHYRGLADEALRISASAGTAAMRTDFLQFALGWHALALQIESSLGGCRGARRTH